MKITIDLDTNQEADCIVLRAIANLLTPADTTIVEPAPVAPAPVQAPAPAPVQAPTPAPTPAPEPEKKEPRKGRAKRTTTPAPEVKMPELPEESEAPFVPEEPKDVKKVDTPIETPEPAPISNVEQPVEEVTPAATGLTYERDVRPLVIELVQHTSLDYTVKLVKEKFGVDSAKAIPPHQFEVAVKLFNDEINNR